MALVLAEPIDVQRATGLSHNGVLLAANSGRLPVFARTKAGRRLFSLEDVEQFARRRREVV